MVFSFDGFERDCLCDLNRSNFLFVLSAEVEGNHRGDDDHHVIGSDVTAQREDGENVYRVVDVDNARSMRTLTAEQQEEAHSAARRVREITGQSRMEDEGQG